MDHNKKDSTFPTWWLNGSGPLALGAASSLVTAAVAWTRHGQPPPDFLSTLIVISIAANAITLDNCRDGTTQRRASFTALAVGFIFLTVVAAAIAYGV